MKKATFLILLCAAIMGVGCSSSNANKSNSAAKEANGESADEQTEAVNETKTERNMDDLTKVIFKTSMGDITIALYDNTPLHKENFLKLVKENYYDGVLFHRIIQGFMIQTGDPDSKGAPAGMQLGNGGPDYTIPAEFRAENYHKRGAVAAARQGDQVNPKKASSATQFYIVQGQVWDDKTLDMMEQRFGKKFTDEQRKVYSTVGGTPHLDGDYTVFGEVVEGMDVVNKIADLPCDRMDRPVEDVKIISVKVIK